MSLTPALPFIRSASCSWLPHAPFDVCANKTLHWIPHALLHSAILSAYLLSYVIEALLLSLPTNLLSLRVYRAHPRYSFFRLGTLPSYYAIFLLDTIPTRTYFRMGQTIPHVGSEESTRPLSAGYTIACVHSFSGSVYKAHHPGPSTSAHPKMIRRSRCLSLTRML